MSTTGITGNTINNAEAMRGYNITVVGFVLMTILVVGLAGPYPKLITGILVLVLAGIILSPTYTPQIVSEINTIFGGKTS